MEQSTNIIQTLNDPHRNWSVWLVVFSMSLAFGVVPAWANIIPIILRPLRIPQRVTGLIGAFSQILTSLSSIVFSLCACILQYCYRYHYSSYQNKSCILWAFTLYTFALKNLSPLLIFVKIGTKVDLNILNLIITFLNY